MENKQLEDGIYVLFTLDINTIGATKRFTRRYELGTSYKTIDEDYLREEKDYCASYGFGFEEYVAWEECADIDEIDEETLELYTEDDFLAFICELGGYEILKRKPVKEELEDYPLE